MDSVHRQDIADMFNRISPRYDRANRLLSMGFDRRWRKKALSKASPRPGECWLDIACGTGDMIETGLHTEPAAFWYGLDPAKGMLEGMDPRPSLAGIPRVVSAAEALPWKDETFHGVTIAFGLRNFENRGAGLREISRVLKPCGRLIVLEFLPQSKDRWGAGALTRLYLDRLLPRLGGMITGHADAYDYLNRSSRAMWDADRLEKELDHAGFQRIEIQPMMLGVVSLVSAFRP